MFLFSFLLNYPSETRIRKKTDFSADLGNLPLIKTVPNHIFVTFVCILVVHRSEHVECNLESLQNREWHFWRSAKTNSDYTILSHIILRSSLLYRCVFPSMQSTALSLWLNKNTRTCFIGMQIHICIWYARDAELNSRNQMLHNELVHIHFRGECATDNV